MRTTTILALLLSSILLIPQAASAVITFDQLTDDTFIVTHRVKFFGGRGQAVRKVYEKTASLCVAAGFTHFEIQDQESQSFQHEESANAGARVRFFFEGGGDRIECDPLAGGDYIEQASVKLDRMGYRPPTRPAPATAAAGSCTSEQMATMVKIGLTESQIKAACDV